MLSMQTKVFGAGATRCRPWSREEAPCPGRRESARNTGTRAQTTRHVKLQWHCSLQAGPPAAATKQAGRGGSDVKPGDSALPVPISQFNWPPRGRGLPASH